MNEEIKNKLTERFDKITAGECDNKDLRDALLKAYIAGGEYGYQYAVEKACEFIRLHIGVDMPVRLTPDGQPLAEDFFNKAEARANAAQNVVEQFKQFMEE